jgi:antitoxin ParD1/3/4
MMVAPASAYAHLCVEASLNAKAFFDNNYQIAEAEMISADLGAQLESFVAKLVETGRYNSKSEVLREGVRLIQEREARLAALDVSIARGLADAEAGRLRPVSEVSERLERRYQAMADRQK